MSRREPENKPRGAERGAAFLILLLISVAIAGILGAIAANQITRALKDKEIARLQTLGVKCNRAIEMVVDAMDVEFRLRGSYPYKFDDDFLDRFQTLDRWIYNKELWAPEIESELILNTFFGESYELTGWCRDGYVYYYESESGDLSREQYSHRDLQGEQNEK
ncbi:MAG TPA: hypothetical protein PKH33_15640 [bacterium]|nr:hypothetical protein [bacterium]